MSRKLVKAKRVQLTIVRNLVKLNKKPTNIIGMCLKFVMKLIQIFRLSIQITRNKKATKNPFNTTWNLIKMNRNQYQIEQINRHPLIGIL